MGGGNLFQIIPLFQHLAAVNRKQVLSHAGQCVNMDIVIYLRKRVWINWQMKAGP